MKISEDEIVHKKAFEHANLNFAEPWALTKQIMLNFSTGFFPMYRGILEEY